MFRLPQSHILLSPHCNICFKHSIRQSHSVSAVSFLLETWNIQLLIIGFHKMKLKKTKFHCWIWLLRCCIIFSENLAKKQKTIVIDIILQFHLLTSEWCSWRHLWMKSIRHKLQKLGQNPKEKEIPHLVSQWVLSLFTIVLFQFTGRCQKFQCRKKNYSYCCSVSKQMISNK